MLRLVSAKVREDIDHWVRDYGADVSLHDYISAKQKKHFPKLLPKIQQSDPLWTESQRIADGTHHLMSGQPLLCRGIARIFESLRATSPLVGN